MDRTDLTPHLHANVRITFWHPDHAPLEGLLLPHGPIGGMMVRTCDGVETVVQMNYMDNVEALVF